MLQCILREDKRGSPCRFDKRLILSCSKGNNIGAPKIRNNYGAMYLFILRLFSIAPHLLVARSSNFAIAKVVTLNIFVSFLYWFHILIYGFFSVLLSVYLSLFKAIAKSKVKLIAIAFKCENE